VPDSEHHQQYYLKIVERLSGRKIAKDFSAGLVISAMEKNQSDRMLSDLGISPNRLLLALAPVAAYGSAKAWLPERFREVIIGLQAAHPASEILLLGGPGEKEKNNALAAGLSGRIHILSGRLSLRQAIIILSRCRLVICNDSGLMHIAASLGTTLLAIFGPTEPQKTAPLASNFRLIHHPSDCAPCKHRECPTDHRCLTAVTSDEVLAAAEVILDMSRRLEVKSE
jgi:heptosyltransferase-2